MISRRALFGLSVGAVAAAKGLPAAKAELRAEDYFTEMDVGVDFGKTPAMAVYYRSGHTQKWLRENVERVARRMYHARFREVKGAEEVPPDFDASPYRDSYLSQARAAIIDEPPE